MQSQLPLLFQAPETATFENYLVKDSDQQLLFSLNSEDEKLIFIWGEEDCGKSHLLQALNTSYQQSDRNTIYLPLSLKEDMSPEILTGLEMMALICLDDIQAITGIKKWEQALFHFFNRCKENNTKLVLAANNSAINLNINLPDLKSRLAWGLTYHLQPLDDAGKIEVLRNRAQNRGFEISDEVANYLFTRASRSLGDLMELLDTLDYASMVEQRKLTIPFIKKYL